MTQIFTNTPAAYRPNVPVQMLMTVIEDARGRPIQVPLTTKVVSEARDDVGGNNKGKGNWRKWFRRIEPTDYAPKPAMVAAAEYRSHVTEPHDEELHTPLFSIVDGRFNPATSAKTNDLLSRIERMLPMVRGAVGPQLVMRNPMGELVSVSAMVGTSAETPEQNELPTMAKLVKWSKEKPADVKVSGPRNYLDAFDQRSGAVSTGAAVKLTTVAVSTDQTPEEAFRALYAAAWSEIVRRAIEAWGMEWVNAVSNSLDENQAFAVAEDYRSEEKRLKDAFVNFAMNAENGLAKASDEESPHCLVVFYEAWNGDLGNRLVAHHNPY